MFTGCGTAMVTPFRQDGSLDEATLRALINRQIDAGIDFLCPCGTTGESPTLTHKEHLRVVEITVEESQGRVPVLAGESKWAGSVNAARIKAGLVRKAASLTPDANDLRYAVCARDEVEHADQDTLTVTAKDMFGI